MCPWSFLLTGRNKPQNYHLPNQDRRAGMVSHVIDYGIMIGLNPVASRLACRANKQLSYFYPDPCAFDEFRLRPTMIPSFSTEM